MTIQKKNCIYLMGIEEFLNIHFENYLFINKKKKKI